MQQARMCILDIANFSNIPNLLSMAFITCMSSDWVKLWDLPKKEISKLESTWPLTCRVWTSCWVSDSYPGLKSTAETHEVPVIIPGLPKEDFTTSEKRGTGTLENQWRWVDRFEAEKLLRSD